ncbi:unnamed protein product [Mytilus coruscus]|uniref:Uncharacterized protein n=1 Tax=Mytilus coruscus TaxID=42192 RepID=A0A6J8A1I5_MYTCO|nr:unnamed protein product [Mytilus coruscus]
MDLELWVLCVVIGNVNQSLSVAMSNNSSPFLNYQDCQVSDFDPSRIQADSPNSIWSGLRATGKKVPLRKCFDIDKLEDIKVKREFVIKLQNRYQVLKNSVRDENETLDEKWNEISDIYTKCSEECIGYKQKTKKKDWITPETWNQINIRRQAKKKVNDTKSPRLKDKYQQDYSDIHRNVKTLVRADKRRFMDNLADQAEEAANKREQGNLYKITKIICGRGKSSPNIPVKDKQGDLLTSENEQEKRWAEHFSEILNRPSPKELPTIPEPNIELEISIEPPTISEISVRFITGTSFGLFYPPITGETLFRLWPSISVGSCSSFTLIPLEELLLLLLPEEHLLANITNAGGLYRLARPRLLFFFSCGRHYST